ncbi:MAG: hypothetical protein Q7T87_10445 [Polaromonas sp.]|nr:hypothetical protein [Polaromonas sp.]
MSVLQKCSSISMPRPEMRPKRIDANALATFDPVALTDHVDRPGISP